MVNNVFPSSDIQQLCVAPPGVGCDERIVGVAKYAIGITKVDFGDNNIVKVITENDIEKNKISKAKKFLRNCKYTKKNIFGHIGIYQFRTSVLKRFVNLKQSKNEIKYRLEQLRAIENGINIDVVYSKNKSFGIDTVKDYVEIKKIMEYKIKKL